MPFIGTGHIWILVILLVVVLIIWGPGKLPDVGSGLGRAIREFRKASSETREEFSKAARHEEAQPAQPAQPVIPVVDGSVPTPVTSVQPLATPATVGGGSAPARPSDTAGAEGDRAAS